MDSHQEPEIEYADESLTTKEFQKRQRQRDYQKAKAAAKEKRLAEKQKKQEDREAERKERDAALWESLRSGTQTTED